MVNPKAKNSKKVIEKNWDLKILLREVFKLGAKGPEGARERDGQSVTSSNFRGTIFF